MKELLSGVELEERCKKIGIDIKGERIFQSSSGRFEQASDYELQRRLSEYECSKRGARLWIIALISSIASVISAATAIITVLTK